jgi:hypothetical protein
MRRIVRYPLQGLLIVLPLGLTAYFIVYAVVFADGLVNDLLEYALDRSSSSWDGSRTCGCSGRSTRSSRACWRRFRS